MKTIAALFLAFTLACADRSQPAPRAMEKTSPSIYPIHAAHVDEHAQKIDLDVDRGHVTIVSMFYGSCPTVVRTHAPTTRTWTRSSPRSIDTRRAER